MFRYRLISSLLFVATLYFVFVTPSAWVVAQVQTQTQTPAQTGAGISGANPTAQAVTEEQLFRELNRLQGRVTIPDDKASVLIQPQGRDYRAFHETYLPWIGAIAILGMIVALAVFFLIRGRIDLERAPDTGIRITRFNAFERFSHWITAASFIVLALTGLNYVFGKRLLFPLIGPEAFAAWSQWAKYAHNVFAAPFILGLVFIVALWVRDSIPKSHDVVWLKRFGGFLSRTRAHPPAGRFNAGQKITFWAVALGGLLSAATGIMMLFPFWTLDIAGMQITQYIHSIAGVLLTAFIIAHIYIGTIGMVGGFEPMNSGEVDLAWARAHHPIWVEEDRAASRGTATIEGRSAPAE